MAKALASADPASAVHLSTAELRENLGRAIQMTAASIAYLAAVWVELERRGEDLSQVRTGLAPYLRDVASGRVAPEAVLAFAGQRMVLRWVAKKSIAEQRLLAQGAPVTVIEPDGTQKRVPATQLTAFDLRLIEAPEVTDAGPVSRRGRQPQKDKQSRVVAITLRMPEYQQLVETAREAGVSISDQARIRMGLPRIGGEPR